MHKVLSEYLFSDMIIRYLTNEEGNIGFEILPASLKDKAAASKKYNIDPLVQVFIRGDDFSGGVCKWAHNEKWTTNLSASI
ncbi:hypothetical protein [Ruminiclostridium papyrosolvens]|uniref:hypothetical protein n=1 Tax=Ruminiclostridium papyrosolvens TaxID=29362 RepID=UPI0001B27B95|nr:hypothetical protein [Ruminiclostridium papyrosolvens]